MKKHVPANIGGGGRYKPSAYSSGRWGQNHGEEIDQTLNEISRI